MGAGDVAVTPARKRRQLDLALLRRRTQIDEDIVVHAFALAAALPATSSTRLAWPTHPRSVTEEASLATPGATLDGDQTPFVVAHRGSSHDAPENTLAAYETAISQGALAAECDVQVTRDGEVVLLHDRSLSRTTNGRGWIGSQTWDQVRDLDAGAWKHPRFTGEGLPRLEDALDLVRGQMRLYIELKAGRGLAERTMATLRRCGTRPEDVVLISFDEGYLATARAADARFARVLLRRKPLLGGSYTQSAVHQALLADAQAVGLAQSRVGPTVCEAARRAGLPVLSFTVNCPDRARELLELGVQGLITDRPQAIARTLRRDPRQTPRDVESGGRWVGTSAPA